MLHTPVVVSLPIGDRRTSFAFYRDGLDFNPMGEPAEDGLMLVPTGGFGWIIGDREVAPRGRSECVLSPECRDRCGDGHGGGADGDAQAAVDLRELRLEEVTAGEPMNPATKRLS